MLEGSSAVMRGGELVLCGLIPSPAALLAGMGGGRMGCVVGQGGRDAVTESTGADTLAGRSDREEDVVGLVKEEEVEEGMRGMAVGWEDRSKSRRDACGFGGGMDFEDEAESLREGGREG